MSLTYRMPKLSSRREYFRLPYPITAGAALAFEGKSYKVAELSEHGLRVMAEAACITVDTQVQGVLTLAMGSRCTIEGVVLRVESESFILRVDRGIKSYDVMREQAYLSKRFPDWKPQPD